MSVQNCIHMDESENLIASKYINTCIYWHLAITSSKKHAFQWDAYRPLRWSPLDVSTGGVPSRVCIFRMCTFQGIYLPGDIPSGGVYLPGGVPSWGYTFWGVYLHGGVPSRGSSRYTLPWKVPGIRHTHPHGQTHASENITFQQLRWRAVKTDLERV